MTARELNPGDRVGRYTIAGPLGRGGMGVVYVARDERLDRDVALKMIGGLADEAARSRFWREARAAASVSHPNICQVARSRARGGLEGRARRLQSGYHLRAQPVFDAVRGTPVFDATVREARDRMRAAQTMFESAGGPETLGLPAATR